MRSTEHASEPTRPLTAEPGTEANGILNKPLLHFVTLTLPLSSGQLQPPGRGSSEQGRTPISHYLFGTRVGSASGMLQEFMAWCDTQASHDAIILIETHWRATPDYISGKWHCIHTSGYNDSEQPDRYAGILCMLSSTTFATPSVREIVPGRLLQVQAQHFPSQRTVTLLGVYQHVQRPHLGAQKNKQLRGHIWHQFQQQITATPARHVLLAAGDFNSTLHHEHPYVGPATPSRDSHNSFDPSFQALLRDHRLTAANTWHARPSHTFEAPGVRSQIDYILVRLQDANNGARQASPLPGFPVGAHRCTNHLPLQSRLHLLPFAFLHNHSATRKPACNLAALQSAVLQNTAQAKALAASVESRLLQQPPGSDLCSEHSAVNLILLEETCKHFPPAGKPDCRISAHPAFRASAKATWALHRCFKRPGLLLMRNIFDRLRYYTAFLRASKALRQQSLTLKRQFLRDQLDQAENAAKQGDQRALFLVARRLAPRSHRGTIRLQDASGRALSASAAMQAIVAYSNSTFAASPDTLPQLPMQGTLALGDYTFSAALSRLNVRKAVPGHCAPAASWRLCSTSISSRLGPLLTRHFAKGSESTLEGDLRDAHVVWLEKPNKPPTSVGALRPIGLMPPCAKAIAAALAQQIQVHLQPLLDHMPQYAYSPGRGCNDAILRVHQHFEQVEWLLQSQASNRFQMRAGVPPLTCYGGMCLSLDLSKAFDSVCRTTLTQSLLEHGVSTDVVGAIQQLHKSARYVFRLDQATGQTLTTCGIKQGCRAAPTLWLCLTLSIMEAMIRQRSVAWLQRILTAFADDFCGCWTIASASDLLRALSDLELLLGVLAQFSLTVNLQKTALLLHVRGKEARRILKCQNYLPERCSTPANPGKRPVSTA